jgi:FdhE protein
MKRDVWLAAHPYLKPVGDLHALVDAIAAEIYIPAAPIPKFDEYMVDYQAGIPLLESERVPCDSFPAYEILDSFLTKLRTSNLPAILAEECSGLQAELQHNRNSPIQSLAGRLETDSQATSYPGLLRYLGWTVLAIHLRSVVNAFGTWREEDGWLRNYCPTCGSPPTMAHLVATSDGRARHLLCGCCHTFWRYRRRGCPFCEDADDRRLAVISFEGECGLRIDCCPACGGYLKIYSGDNEVLLADWTSLHLDIVASDRGLKRRAASLYEI